VDDQHGPIFVPPIAIPGSRDDDDAPVGRAWEPIYVEPTLPAEYCCGFDDACRPPRSEGVAPPSEGARREGWRVEPVPMKLLTGPPAPAEIAPPADEVQEKPEAAAAEAPTEPPPAVAPEAKAAAAEAGNLAAEQPQEAAILPAPPQAELLPGKVRQRARVSPSLDLPGLRGSRRRRAIWILIGLLIIAGAIWYITHGVKQPTTGRFQSGGPMPVGTAQVKKGDMPVTLTALGTVTPLATVTVQTQINGQLTEVAFREGQMVKKGDFLAQIDPRPYEVALEQAQGQLAKDQAALNNAEVDLARYRTLAAQNSIARQTVDTQAALVAQDKGVVLADQAQVHAQQLNLTYCHIVAPISGRVGLRQVDPGNYVQTSSATGIVVITQLQPISVIFTLPEDNLPTLLKRLHAGAKLQATAFDRTGTIKLDTGTLDTIDNQIDTTTGTVKLRAVFNNDDGILFPNQFVNVQLLVDTLHDVDIVPNSAIERGAPGTFVYVVKPDNTVAIQKVELGPTEGVNQAITKGLSPGDVVVTDGADRLKDGAKVTLAAAGKPAGGAPAAKGEAAPPNPTAPTAAPAPAAGEPAPSGSGNQPGARRHRGSGQGQPPAPAQPSQPTQ